MFLCLVRLSTGSLSGGLYANPLEMAIQSAVACFEVKDGGLFFPCNCEFLHSLLDEFKFHHAPVQCHTLIGLVISFISRVFFCVCAVYVTLHHEMSLNVPDGHFHVFIFSESKFYAIYNGENHFQIRGIVAELHVFEYGDTTFGTFEKACFKC